MKTIIKLTLAAALAAGTLQASAQDDALARLKAARAAELGQPADAAPTPPVPTDASAPALAPAAVAPPIEAQAVVQVADSDVTPTPMSTNGITLNFRNAPLNTVLAYISDAAGFIIVMNVQRVQGTVTVISPHPMSKDEVVDVLNNALNQLGYAAIRDGRMLTIMSKQDAKTSNIPVKIGNVSTNIPKNAEIVTQIIPIRFVDAQQLVVDISPFVSPQAIIIANQAGNSIIITDTQVNIRHLLEIISSIDASAEMETAVQVFPLKFANPNDVVATLAGVFPSATGGAQTINVGRGGRGGGGGGGGRGGGGAGGGSAQRIQKAQQVLAVADGRTQSVIVTCAKDMMPQIKDMITQLDLASERDTQVYTLRVDNADPYEAANVLQQMFGGTTARGSTTTSPLLQREQQTLPTSGGTTTGGGARGGGGGGIQF
jgi:type II secretory pathway component GspD/PulD (secretin)